MSVSPAYGHLVKRVLCVSAILSGDNLPLKVSVHPYVLCIHIHFFLHVNIYGDMKGGNCNNIEEIVTSTCVCFFFSWVG
jgi:hypothetical protein